MGWGMETGQQGDAAGATRRGRGRLGRARGGSSVRRAEAVCGTCERDHAALSARAIAPAPQVPPHEPAPQPAAGRRETRGCDHRGPMLLKRRILKGGGVEGAEPKESSARGAIWTGGFNQRRKTQWLII